MITSLEKKIYNTHLAVSRSLRGKPFKLKESFEGFTEDPRYAALKRIGTFFTKYPDVCMDSYFMAPYKLYPDVGYFDLFYFASPRAIKSYTIYKQQLLQQSPDSQKDQVKESLIFLGNYCLKNNIPLKEYPSFKENGISPAWVYHIKHNKINPYSLMEFQGIFKTIQEMGEDEREILLGNFGTNFLDYRQKYVNSVELKPYLEKATKCLKFFIDKNLKS